jgi:YnbE-like lipoprotein
LRATRFRSAFASACRASVGSALPALLLALALAACTHRVQVEAPKDPIVINLNVKIEQEVRVRVDREVEDLLADNPELF